MPSVTLFAGPTARGVSQDLLQPGGMVVRPPARRGDIDSLLGSAAAAGVIVLCDGVFESSPAVSHAELCRALDAGWQVWGVSSIGAIRAFELRLQGMRGYGYVYRQFARFEDFTDDELCLLHLPDEPYVAITEALVNVRYALEMRAAMLKISGLSQHTLIAGLRELWFGDRSIERMRQIMLGPAGIKAAAAQGLLAWLDQHRIKTIDLRELLMLRPWEK
jgi:hypothetical protein